MKNSEDPHPLYYLSLSRLTLQVTFDPVYGMLNGLNVGDSGALLVRR